MDAFFNVFAISRKRVGTFEHAVKKEDGRQGFIDFLWKGNILIEFKSLGKDLDKAQTQAKDYFPGIKNSDLPNTGWFSPSSYTKNTRRHCLQKREPKNGSGSWLRSGLLRAKIIGRARQNPYISLR